MQFNKIGNKKNNQYYKEILRFILLDIYSRVKNYGLKNFPKKSL